MAKSKQEIPTQSQWEEARRRAATRYGEGSIPYRAVLNGHYDTGNLVSDKLAEVMKEGIADYGHKD